MELAPEETAPCPVTLVTEPSLAVPPAPDAAATAAAALGSLAAAQAAAAAAPASPDLSGISAERMRDDRVQYRVDIYAPAADGSNKRQRKYIGKFSSLAEAVKARDEARAKAPAPAPGAGAGAASAGGAASDGPKYYGVTRLAARRVAAGSAPPQVQRWQAAAPKAAGLKPAYIGCFFSAELAAQAVDAVRRSWDPPATSGFNFPEPGETAYVRASRRTADELTAVPFRSHKKQRPKDGDASPKASKAKRSAGAAGHEAEGGEDDDDEGAAGADAAADAMDVPPQEGPAGAAEDAAAGLVAPGGDGVAPGTWNALLES